MKTATSMDLPSALTPILSKVKPCNKGILNGKLVQLKMIAFVDGKISQLPKELQ
jgi:hypothetical protein